MKLPLKVRLYRHRTHFAKWTRSDSNRRSPPCKGGAFPLGHGPVHPTGQRCRREDSNLHAQGAADPKSAASANSATSATVDGTSSSWLYSRFCLNRHLSLRLTPEATPGLPGVTWHRRRRCDETELLTQPSPLALLPVARSPSRRHCCHRWWALTRPEGPLACAKPPFQP